MNELQLMSFLEGVRHTRTRVELGHILKKLNYSKYQNYDEHAKFNILIGIYSVIKKSKEIKEIELLNEEFSTTFTVLYDVFLMNYKNITDEQIKLLKENYVSRDIIYDIYLELGHELNMYAVQNLNDVVKLIDKREGGNIKDLLVFSNKIKEPQIIYDMYYGKNKRHCKGVFYDTTNEFMNVVIVNEIIFNYASNLIKTNQLREPEFYEYTYKLLAGYVFYKYKFDNELVKMFVGDINELMNLIKSAFEEIKNKL